MWAAAAAGVEVGRVPAGSAPLHDRRLVRFHGDEEIARLFLQEITPNLPRVSVGCQSDPMQFVRQSFQSMSLNQCRLLRSKIPRSTADCRAYMSPPVPDAYEGNCVALCMASLSGSELAAVREAIAEAKRKPLHDLARWRTKFAVIQRGRRGSRVRASRRGQAVEGHLQVGGGGAERHITLGGGHGWENFYPHTKSFAGSPPRGEKNASWGPQRLEML
ncbi:hypothetical protein ACQJBY_047770 [Aegilops geniculata]